MACFFLSSFLPVCSKLLINPYRVRPAREGRLEEVEVQPRDAHERNLLYSSNQML